MMAAIVRLSLDAPTVSPRLAAACAVGRYEPKSKEWARSAAPLPEPYFAITAKPWRSAGN